MYTKITLYWERSQFRTSCVVMIFSETELSELTLEDIAKQAGVSRSTVSRVVNNHPYVKAEVRKRVLKGHPG